MQIRRYDRKRSAFIVKWDDFEQFYTSVTKDLPETTITISCTDKLKRELQNSQDLKNYQNSKRAAIMEITLVAHDAIYSQRFSLSLGNDDDDKNVEMSLDSSEEIGIRLNELYQDFLDSVRPWYNWMTRIKLFYVCIAVWFIVTMYVVARNTIDKSSNVEHGDARINTWVVLVVLLLYFAAPFVIGFGLDLLKAKVFPIGTFAFGDGRNRYERSEVFRTVVVVSFVLAVIAGVLVKVLF